MSPGWMCSTGGIAPEKTRWNSFGSKTCSRGALGGRIGIRVAFHFPFRSSIEKSPAIPSRSTVPLMVTGGPSFPDRFSSSLPSRIPPSSFRPQAATVIRSPVVSTVILW